MPLHVLVAHALAVAVLALGLSGLSVGLGACLPNFRETDPSKIAVGFGGTLNLVAGLLFLIVVIGVMAAPFHIVLANAENERAAFTWWPWLGSVAGLFAGALTILLPLRAGARNLRSMEF
jgi:ABC-2 type transport system permease protein